MGDHEHACLRNGTQQPHPHDCPFPARFSVAPGGVRGGEWASRAALFVAFYATERRPRRLKCRARRAGPMVKHGVAGLSNAVMCQPPFGGSGITACYIRGGSTAHSACADTRILALLLLLSHTHDAQLHLQRWVVCVLYWSVCVPLDSFSNQVRLPAELKHITKRRKRN